MDRVNIYHHANVVVCVVLTHLHRLVQYHVHERIKATQNAGHCPTAIEL